MSALKVSSVLHEAASLTKLIVVARSSGWRPCLATESIHTLRGRLLLSYTFCLQHRLEITIR